MPARDGLFFCLGVRRLYSAQLSSYEHFMKNPKQIDRSAFDNSVWQQFLPSEALQDMKTATQSRSFHPGQRLSEIGDISSHLIGVERGFVAIHTDDDHQLDVIGHIFGPGEWFGIAAILSDKPRFVGSSSLTEVRVVQLPKKAFERIAQEHPILWKAIAVLSAMNAEIAVRVARDTLLKSPTDRCAATLNRLVGRQPLPCELPITQSQLADICSLSRGSVSKALTALEATGAIARGYSSLTVNETT